MHKKVILLILDGVGLGKPDKFNAYANAHKPNLDKIIKEFPNIAIKASGADIGLDAGQLGTSEINHQIMGTGVVIMQDLPKINRAIAQGSFFSNENFLKVFDHVNKNNSRLHLVGIVSDGGVHAHINHLFALLKAAHLHNVKQVYIHVFADGRDTSPRSVTKYLEQLDAELKHYPGYKIATLQGRVFLDRDRDWAKTQTGLDLLTKGKGNHLHEWQDAVNLSYNQAVYDEYFSQYLFESEGCIAKNDGVVFTHYRTDRMYQIVKALINEHIENLLLDTFVEVSEEFPQVLVNFPREKITTSLAQILSEQKLPQQRITENEKFAHLTYFFNGGREQEYPYETWTMIPSNRLIKPYYQFDPAMKVHQIVQKIMEFIEQGSGNFLAANLVNGDMIGHTGDYHAAVVAIQAIDFAIGRLMELLKNRLDEYALIITADHGNCECMWDYEANLPSTAHTTNPVPFILATHNIGRLDPKENLANIAPTILELMGLDQPKQMRETSLLLKTKSI